MRGKKKNSIKGKKESTEAEEETKGKTRKWSASPPAKGMAHELQSGMYYDYHKLKKNNNEA